MSGEKTHDPTPKRLQDARKRGEISQSKEIPVLLKYAAFLLVFVLGFDAVWNSLKDLLSACLSVAAHPSAQRLSELLSTASRSLLYWLLTFVVASVVAGCLGVFLQIGVVFSSEAASPSFKKFNVVQNIKQMVSAQTLLQLALSLLKVMLYCTLVAWLLLLGLSDSFRLPLLNLSAIGDFAQLKIRNLLLVSLFLFLVFAVLDWALTRWFFRRNLRMSHQDIIDEHKQTEGDPHIKQHRKQQHRSLLNSSLNRVSQAKLLVNNPSHISVALDYEPGVHDLPYILAIETDDMALLMRRKAMQAGVPLVNHIELARGLYRDGEVDAYIPSQHVALAAEVFRQVLSQLRAASLEADPSDTDLQTGTDNAMVDNTSVDPGGAGADTGTDTGIERVGRDDPPGEANSG